MTDYRSNRPNCDAMTLCIHFIPRERKHPSFQARGINRCHSVTPSPIPSRLPRHKRKVLCDFLTIVDSFARSRYFARIRIFQWLTT